jgi:hypothetical protein
MIMQWNRMLALGAGLLLAAAVAGAQGPAGGRGMRGFGAGPAGFAGGGFGMHKVITGAPYSAVAATQTQHTLEGGNQVSRSTQVKEYRDALGRVRTEQTGPNGATVVTIFDPVAGFVYRLNPAKLTGVQIALPASTGTAATGTAPTPRQPKGATVTKTDLGQQTVNGVLANGTQTTITIAAGALGNTQPIVSTRTVWVSVDLQIPVSIKSTDPRFGSSDMELTSIVEGAQDPTLFQVPSNYTLTQRTPGSGHGK